MSRDHIRQLISAVQDRVRPSDHLPFPSAASPGVVPDSFDVTFDDGERTIAIPPGWTRPLPPDWIAGGTRREGDNPVELLTGSFMGYVMPRADTLSAIDCESNPVPTKTNPSASRVLVKPAMSARRQRCTTPSSTPSPRSASATSRCPPPPNASGARFGTPRQSRRQTSGATKG